MGFISGILIGGIGGIAAGFVIFALVNVILRNGGYR